MRMALFTVAGAILGFLLSIGLAMNVHWSGGKLAAWGFVILGTSVVTCFARWLAEDRGKGNGHTPRTES